MSIACPYCKAVLNPKGLKPGRFQPKCPGCAKPFIIVVPDDPDGTISVQQLVAKVGAGPDTAKIAKAAPAKPAPKPAPKKRVLSVEEQAALLLEGKDPADYGELGTGDEDEDPNATVTREPEAAPVAEAPKPKTSKPSVSPPKATKPPVADAPTAPKAKTVPKPARDPNVTGDFTETDEAAPAPKPTKAPAPKAKAAPPTVVREPDANATGDFTQANEPEPPKAKKPAPQRTVAREPDANATGDFTTPGEGEQHEAPGEATGEFTKPPADADADSEPDDKPAPKRGKLKPAHTVKAGESVVEDDLDDEIPPKLGGYEVIKVLGKGGMGAVLLGRQISLDRKVAIKVMHPKIATNPSFVARFTREAYAAAQLTHHNVIQIYDIGEDHGQHFFSMEFVQGQSLMELVKKEGKLAADVAVGYTLQAARGLRYGHNQGMVHRDIKPDNLMLNTEGIVKVADLGLVKLPGGELPEQAGALPSSEDDAPGNSNLTRAGAVMGTPAYMSPEQSTDSASVDGRADIYSLGCTLYVLVTGKPPFEGRTAMEIITKHQTEPIIPPEVIVKRVPKRLSTILLKMLAKKPIDRYQTMDEVITALEEFLGMDRAGPFNPKEEQADQLEKCAHQLHHRSKGGLKRSLSLGFFLVCVLGVVGGAFAGMAALAGGILGLAFLAPVAYFVVHGTFTGGVVFKRLRAVVFGMRFFDWLMWFGGALLFLTTLFLFGLLWSWLGFALVAVGLGFLLWFLTDRAAMKAQEAPLEEARGLLKSLRLHGLEEDAVRLFVCKFSGPYWERLYESLFGYEAMLAARAARKGDTGETWKKFGTWREPIVQWADARVEARRLAKERAHLQKVEAKALVAEGASKADAKAKAEEMAGQMVDQAVEAKQARKEGKEVSVREMVESARERRRPKAGLNIAGKKRRSLSLTYFLNDWGGRRLRFALGALLFATGLFWMHQNQLLQGSRVLTAITDGTVDAAQPVAGKVATRPLSLPGDFVPAEVKPALNTLALPLTGLLVLLNGVFYFGWRPTLVTVPGAVVAVCGPLFGIPDVPPLSAQHLSLIIGAVFIVVVARFLRQ